MILKFINIIFENTECKAILLTTLLLITLSALYFFFFEFGNLPLGKRLWRSLFHSVTTRSAGFNTANLKMISETGTAITILLMLVGGLPESTAGNNTGCSGFNNGFLFFEKKNIRILMLYLILFLTGGFVINRIEGLPLLTCLYEIASGWVNTWNYTTSRNNFAYYFNVY